MSKVELRHLIPPFLVLLSVVVSWQLCLGIIFFITYCAYRDFLASKKSDSTDRILKVEKEIESLRSMIGMRNFGKT